MESRWDGGGDNNLTKPRRANRLKAVVSALGYSGMGAKQSLEKKAKPCSMRLMRSVSHGARKSRSGEMSKKIIPPQSSK